MCNTASEGSQRLHFLYLLKTRLVVLAFGLHFFLIGDIADMLDHHFNPSLIVENGERPRFAVSSILMIHHLFFDDLPGIEHRPGAAILTRCRQLLKMCVTGLIFFRAATRDLVLFPIIAVTDIEVAIDDD